MKKKKIEISHFFKLKNNLEIKKLALLACHDPRDWPSQYRLKVDIVELRTAGLSQREVSEELEVSTASVSYYESKIIKFMKCFPIYEEILRIKVGPNFNQKLYPKSQELPF